MEMTTIGRSLGWRGTACRKSHETLEPITVSAREAQLALLDWGFRLNLLRLVEAALALLVPGSRLLHSSSLQLVGCQAHQGPLTSRLLMKAWRSYSGCTPPLPPVGRGGAPAEVESWNQLPTLQLPRQQLLAPCQIKVVENNISFAEVVAQLVPGRGGGLGSPQHLLQDVLCYDRLLVRVKHNLFVLLPFIPRNS